MLCWGMLRNVKACKVEECSCYVEACWGMLTCSDGGWPGGCSFSQCSTTVIFPLLSIIFQDGISSWSPRAARVSQTIFGIVDTTETHKFVYFMWEWGGLKEAHLGWQCPLQQVPRPLRVSGQWKLCSLAEFENILHPQPECHHSQERYEQVLQH